LIFNAHNNKTEQLRKPSRILLLRIPMNPG